MSTKSEVKDESEILSQANLKEFSFTDNLDLPDTVTRLHLNGCNVYIVGTAHFSHQSIDDVSKTIELVRPQVVMLELCKARQHILKMDADQVYKDYENLNVKKVREMMKQNGVLQGVLQLLMIYMSSNVSKQLDMPPGGEFKMGYEKAEALNNDCRIILGDRDIAITFKRALHSLSFYQKIKFAFKILFESDNITAEDVEKSKNKDMLEDMMQEMSAEFPRIADVFIDERDQFLKHSMAYGAMMCCHVQDQENSPCNCSQTEPCCQDDASSSDSDENVASSPPAPASSTSPALSPPAPSASPSTPPAPSIPAASLVDVNEKGDTGSDPPKTPAMVAIVGIGHVKGIARYWNTEIDHNSLISVPEGPSREMKILKWTFVVGSLTTIGGLGYLGYRLLRR